MTDQQICSNCGKTLREQMKGCNQITCYRQFLTKRKMLTLKIQHNNWCFLEIHPIDEEEKIAIGTLHDTIYIDKEEAKQIIEQLQTQIEGK